eukprot:m.351549 g.351549  ORF g.351549 m.351549 type:complete len:144 (-) comp16274_c0_seq1:1914-2345(-)
MKGLPATVVLSTTTTRAATNKKTTKTTKQDQQDQQSQTTTLLCVGPSSPHSYLALPPLFQVTHFAISTLVQLQAQWPCTGLQQAYNCFHDEHLGVAICTCTQCSVHLFVRQIDFVHKLPLYTLSFARATWLCCSCLMTWVLVH